jgi:hypothetical protein
MEGVVKIASTASFCAAALLVFQLTGASAYAAAPCKGLDEAGCSADEKCSWVKPGKTLLGKEKKGYCRAKPAKKAPAPKSTPKAPSAQ